MWRVVDTYFVRKSKYELQLEGKKTEKLLHQNTDSSPEADVRDESQISERRDTINMGTFHRYI